MCMNGTIYIRDNPWYKSENIFKWVFPISRKDKLETGVRIPNIKELLNPSLERQQ